MIRFGEWIRYHKDETRPYQWNHAVAVVGDKLLIEALAKGVVQSPTSKYTSADYWYVHTDLDTELRANATSYWNSMLGHKYGYETLITATLKLVLGIYIGLSNPDHVICSGTVAAGLGIYKWRSIPALPLRRTGRLPRSTCHP